MCARCRRNASDYWYICAPSSAVTSNIMSDRHAQVSVKLEQVKSPGNDAEQEGVHPGEQVPASPVSPDPAGVTTADTDADDIPAHPRKTPPKQKADEKDPCNTEKSFYASEDSHRLTKNSSNLTVGVKIQEETNGNLVQPSTNLQEARSENAMKPARKRRPVTVDSAKAKTSLEALKLSIKQLKWKEVRRKPLLCATVGSCACFLYVKRRN